MVKVIHGPTYKYQNERLIQPTAIYIQDHLYNEHSHSFSLQELLDNSVCDPKLHVLIFDHVNQQDEFQDYQCVYFPALLDREADEFAQANIVPDWQQKKFAFNFMINKPRPHRLQLLELIHGHNLNNFSHSLCWKMSPVSTVATTDYRIGSETQMNQGFKNGQYTNAYTYQKLLQKTVFEPSCVSLITEPVYWERQTIVTEKTIMAMYGGTIPIWVGGWRIADYLKLQGFDVFDDVVDHSYQDLTDPAGRVRCAIELNIDLLQQPDPKFISKFYNRLWHNYELAHSNLFKHQCWEIQDSFAKHNIVLNRLS